MRKILLAVIWMGILSCAALAGGQIQDGLCKVFLGDNDSVLFILEMQRDTLREGAVFQFFQNGDVEKVAWYENGILEGASRSFWADGKVKSFLEYRSGVLDGRVGQYDRQGRPQMELTYSQGRLNGMGYYYEDGILKNTVMYEYGKAVHIADTEI